MPSACRFISRCWNDFGWDAAPVLVGVGAALAAVLLCYAIARRLEIDPWLSAAGAAMLAAYPVFLFTSIQPLSDTLATTWCLAAMYAALRARERTGWAVACGMAFAIAVLVRATNVLLLPALIVVLGFDVRRLVLAGLGGLPGALWLGFYNHTLYGGALRAGYDRIAEAFGWSYGAPTLVHFAKWLALMLPTIVLALPLAALAVPGVSHTDFGRACLVVRGVHRPVSVLRDLARSLVGPALHPAGHARADSRCAVGNGSFSPAAIARDSRHVFGKPQRSCSGFGASGLAGGGRRSFTCC